MADDTHGCGVVTTPKGVPVVGFGVAVAMADHIVAVSTSSGDVCSLIIECIMLLALNHRNLTIVLVMSYVGIHVHVLVWRIVCCQLCIFQAV
jgi:hypothetical protein